MQRVSRPSTALALIGMALLSGTQVGPAQAVAGSVATEEPAGALTAPRAVLGPLPDARYSGEVTVKGRVAGIVDGVGLEARDARITFDPIRGASRTVTVRTDALGNFAVRHSPTVRTAVRATALAPTAARAAGHLHDPGGGPGAVQSRRNAPGRSGLERARPVQRQGMHPGTKHLVQVRDGGVWRNDVRGRAQTDGFRFVLALSEPGTHTVRVFVIPGPKWLPTPSETVTVRL